MEAKLLEGFKKSSSLSELDDFGKLILAKEIIQRKVDTKINLFAECIELLSMTQKYPYLSLKLRKNYSPIDVYDRIIMRSCIKKHLIRNSKLSQFETTGGD